MEMDQISGKSLEGKVDFIYPYLDRKSRSNNIRLVFDNPDLILKPDMFATIRIYVPSAGSSLAVPAESVIYSGKRQIVFVTKGDGKFEPREVRTGIESDDGYVQVLSGLFDDEEVVVSGQFLLDSESRTREAIAKMRAAQTQRKQSISEKQESKVHTHSADEHTAEEMSEIESEEAPDAAEHIHEVRETGQRIDIDRLYACPMHPKFLTTDPDARCPVCEMKVVPTKELKEKINLEKVEFYTCPMHPEFLTTDPDARCPECGMKLEKVKKGQKNIP